MLCLTHRALLNGLPYAPGLWKSGSSRGWGETVGKREKGNTRIRPGSGARGKQLPKSFVANPALQESVACPVVARSQ